MTRAVIVLSLALAGCFDACDPPNPPAETDSEPPKVVDAQVAAPDVSAEPIPTYGLWTIPVAPPPDFTLELTCAMCEPSHAKIDATGKTTYTYRGATKTTTIAPFDLGRVVAAVKQHAFFNQPDTVGSGRDYRTITVTMNGATKTIKVKVGPEIRDASTNNAAFFAVMEVVSAANSEIRNAMPEGQ